MTRWAEAPLDRTQRMMFSPSLDHMIPEDHPVRLFDEILGGRDWSAWEAHYVPNVGQPAIHPRTVASVVLYGLSQGLRSSRRLEWACGYAVDFLWLTQGREIDHSTICDFRKRFAKELKDLFREIGRVAMAMGMVRLNQIALDGTKVRANSSRYGTATTDTIERRLAILDAEIERMFAQAEETDRGENELFGESVSPTHLPRELADRVRRRETLAKALEAARGREADA